MLKQVQHDKIKHQVIPELNSGQALNLFQDLKKKKAKETKRWKTQV